MNDRQENLLTTIVVEHLKNSQPVGSKLLADKFGLSSATLRNEMADLEKAGFLLQPHTSAGRVPTEKGYKYYLENFLAEKKLAGTTEKSLEKIFQDYEQPLKPLAKAMAEISQQAIFVAFAKDDAYYTGISNLFAQPEFYQPELIFHLSQIVDHLDDVVKNIFDEIDNQPKILLGKENPFGEECASLLVKYQWREQNGLLGILGPMRMDYGSNLALINFANKLLKEKNNV